MIPLGSQDLEKQLEDPLAKLKLPTEPMRAVGLNIERCTTANRKKAISKGHQVVESSIIKLSIVYNDLGVLLG